MAEIDSEVWVGREGVGELKKGGERGGGAYTLCYTEEFSELLCQPAELNARLYIVEQSVSRSFCPDAKFQHLLLCV